MSNKYAFTIRGVTPLILDRDDVDWADRTKAWQKNKDNKSKSVAGDDRSPAWKWIGSLNSDGETVCIPVDYLFSCFRLAGQKVPTGKGKGAQSFKSSVASFLVFDQDYYTLSFGKPSRTLSMVELTKMADNENFEEHKAFALANGFRLFVKRARPQKTGSKHVRVRPIFDSWSIGGTLTVYNDTLAENFASVCETAGTRVGLGNWRPGLVDAPGAYGKFVVELKEVK